jgi:hypothetical protein
MVVTTVQRNDDDNGDHDDGHSPKDAFHDNPTMMMMMMMMMTMTCTDPSGPHERANSGGDRGANRHARASPPTGRAHRGADPRAHRRAHRGEPLPWSWLGAAGSLQC